MNEEDTKAAEEDLDGLEADYNNAGHNLSELYRNGFRDGHARGIVHARRWIPVSERLPEEGVTVAVLYEVALRPRTATGCYENGQFSLWDISEGLWPYDGPITGWMPLPNLPEE